MIITKTTTGVITVTKADKTLVEVLQDACNIPVEERKEELGCMQAVIADLTNKVTLTKEAVAK